MADGDFENGDLFSFREDEEQLIHESPEEAIQEFWDCTLEEIDQLEVYAFKREELKPTWATEAAERVASNALDQAQEEWSEQYGCPEGDDFDGGQSHVASQAIAGAIRGLFAMTPVWRCKRVGSRVYTKEQVVAILGLKGDAKGADHA